MENFGIEAARAMCEKSTVVLVATTNLGDDAGSQCFQKRKGTECDDLFKDVKRVIKAFEDGDFVKQILLYTEFQERIILLGT